MKKYKLILFLVLYFTVWFGKTYAQSVAIGEREFSPHSSAVLEVKSTSKGVLVPRVTFTQRVHIQTNAQAVGLLVFQTDREVGLYYYDGSVWQYLAPPTKQDLPNLARVATSGSYLDLIDKPTIPSELRELQQDEFWAMYVTKSEKDAWNAAAAEAGITIDGGNGSEPPTVSVNWSSISNKPFIPTHLRDLEQDYLYFMTVTKAEKDAWNASSSFSGSWHDLQDKPIIPIRLRDFVQDSLYCMSVTKTEKDIWSSKSDFSGRWADLKDRPTILTHIKDFEPDNLYFMTVSKQQVDSWDATAIANSFSGSWYDLQGKPNFHIVATNGNYNDLENKPIIARSLGELLQHNWAMYVSQAEKNKWNASSNFTGRFEDLQNRPEFAPVATSGNYEALLNRPLIPTTLDQINDGVQYVRFTPIDKTNLNRIVESTPTTERPLPINRGGTGATTVSEARRNLGLGDYGSLERHLRMVNMQVIEEMQIDYLGRVITLGTRNMTVSTANVSGMALGAEYEIGEVYGDIQNWIAHPAINANGNEIASTKFVRDAIGRIGGTGDVISNGYNSNTNFSELKIKSDVVLGGSPRLSGTWYNSDFASRDYVATTKFLIQQINSLRTEITGADNTAINDMAKRVMPYGTIIMWNEANTTPDNIDGAGSCWRELSTEMGGRFPVGVGMYSPTSGDGDVGASYTHKDTRDHQNKIGRNQVSLTMEQMPKHGHNIGNTNPNNGNGAYGVGSATNSMSNFTGGTVELAEGQSMPHENRPPFYVVRFFQYVCN
jgi:hypothetical protein